MDAQCFNRPRSLSVEPALLAELSALNADYAACLDGARYADWVELFAAQCEYRLQPRENFEQGLPLCTMALESRGMLHDRVYGIEHTLFHQPYHQRHVLGPVRVISIEQAEGSLRLTAETPYVVFRVRHGELPEVFNVGRYLDELVREAGRLKFASRWAIFDSEMVANSIIYPV